MSFSKIVLPNTVITDFYQHSLVLIDNEIADIEPKHPPVKADENHTNISVSQQPPTKVVNTEKNDVKLNLKTDVFQPPERRNVEVSDTTGDATTTAAGSIIITENKKWYLGDNRKNVTFVVNDKDALYLKDEALDLLTKLLPALKLNLGDVAIVNIAHQPADARKIKYELNATIVVLFGVKAEEIDLPFKIPDYKEQQYNVCRYIQLPSLDSLLGDSVAVRTEKSKVWVELKKLFGV